MTMHRLDREAHRHLTASASLPPHRRMTTGRTYPRAWDPISDAAALHLVRRRASALDRLCWLASGVLLVVTGWMVWG